MPLQKFILMGAIATLLASCQTEVGGGAAGAGFKTKYFAARGALEQGHYDKAARGYKSLIAISGPFEPRIRLEYAHSLLRAQKFEEAAHHARSLAAGQSGVARAAALAVQATAEHELALAEISRGGSDGRQIALLKSAKSAMDEVLKSHPDLDPLGGLAQRRNSVTQLLSSLG